MRAWLAGILVCGCGSHGAVEVADAPISTKPDAPKVASDAAGDAASAVDQCFPIGDPDKPHPNYDQFHPIMNADCSGTNYQAITGIEKIAFLGDSITTGTPPTLPTDFYRILVSEAIVGQYGLQTEVQDCSKWGARTTDLLGGGQQIQGCFGDVETKTTLVVMTMGGNDMNSILGDATNGDTAEQTMMKVDQTVANLDAALTYLRDPAHFPNGSYVVFANVYEFTDGTGDLASCPSAAIAGYTGSAPAQLVPAYMRIEEQYLNEAISHGVDMVFSLEQFCGHGFHRDDPASPCYRGPNTDLWFDPLTCVHPNTDGHHAMAHLFETTIAD